MAFVIVVTPGTVLAVNTLADNATLNLLGQPTIAVTGNLADLSNVDTTAPAATGQPLTWNAGSSKWEPCSGTVARGYLQTMQGCTASAAGLSGAAPGSNAGDQLKFLRADGTWQVPNQSPSSDLFAAQNYL